LAWVLHSVVCSGIQPVISGPPTRSVRGSIVFARRASDVVCRRHLSSVGVCNTPRRNVTRQGAARGGPVVLRPVVATPCSTPDTMVEIGPGEVRHEISSD